MPTQDCIADITRRLSAIRSKPPPARMGVVTPLDNTKWQVMVIRQPEPTWHPPAEMELQFQQVDFQHHGDLKLGYAIMGRTDPLTDIPFTLALATGVTAFLQGVFIELAMLLAMCALVATLTIRIIHVHRCCRHAANEIRWRLQSITPPPTGAVPDQSIFVLPQSGIAFCITPQDKTPDGR